MLKRLRAKLEAPPETMTPDPDQAAFPYFSPRRLGATGVSDCEIWSTDFRERLPEDDMNRPGQEEIDERRRNAAAEFDSLGQTLVSVARSVPSGDSQ